MQPMLKRNNNNRGQKFSRGPNRFSGKSSAAQRNNFQQTFEKYLMLAREALSTGDRILAESYYQFAEHYLRMLNDIKPIELEITTEEALNEGGEVACVEADATASMHQEGVQRGRARQHKEAQPLHS